MWKFAYTPNDYKETLQEQEKELNRIQAEK